MDQQKLRTLVFEKTGVRIDIDDPVFALVALNEAVLAEAVERHVALLDDATASLADQAQALIDGGHLNTHAERAPRSAAPSAALLKPTPAPTVPLEARFAAIMAWRRRAVRAAGADGTGAVLQFLAPVLKHRP
ncbi:hypothetical protein LP420_24750 [Massilia sp. B-10]|nr:hypothetical protein LP420_24750 [Massilia sp. B-10]